MADMLRKKLMGDYSGNPSAKNQESKASQAKSKKKPASIVDLHFDQLPSYVKDSSTQTPLELQLKHAEEMLKQSFDASMSTVILIHGNGDDVLSMALQKRIRSKAYIAHIETLYEAPYKGGAMKIHFKR